MGTTQIEISHVRSPASSVGSHEDEFHDGLRENGVAVSPVNASPQLSDVHPQSHSDSSHHGEFSHVKLSYPDELPGDLDLADSASRISLHDPGPPARTSRPSSVHVAAPRRHHHPEPRPHREPTRARQREPREPPEQLESPTESGTSDSAEDFLREGPGPGPRPDMPRSQIYYSQNGYTQSSSSGSYYPPNHLQVIPTQPPPPHPYPQPYPTQLASPPPPMAYPPTTMGYQPHHYPHHPPSHISSPPYSASSAYGPPSVVPYAQTGYFPPQYGPQYQPAYSPYPLAPQMAPQMAPQIPHPMPQYQPIVPPVPYNITDAYRVHSPPLTAAHSEASAAKNQDPTPKLDEEAILKLFEDKMKLQSEEIKASQLSREEIMREATEQIQKEALAAEQRREAEAKIREEARKEAIRAYEEKEKAAAEQAAREKQIRKEAAEAALKAAAEEAAAKAERAAAEQKIAADAAAAAKSEAEKAAADAASAAKDAAEKAQKEAADKLKEAEEAAAQAKADAEAAEKQAAAAKAPEKKKPVRFKDAIGRNYNFPFERCCRWQDMEGLINQAFQHIENLAEHVHSGHYDLLGPDKEIIMPQYWNQIVEPDMHITMMLWPLPEPKNDGDPEPISPPLDDGGILNLDDVLGGTGRRRRPDKEAAKKRRGNSKGPSAIGMWMLGGAPPKPKGKR